VKRTAGLLVFLLLALVPATSAGAKSFWISRASVDVVVNDDASLSVTEYITFDFSASFSGA